MTVDIIFIVIGLVLTVVGIVGCVFPGVPGTPLNYVAVLLLHFTSFANYSVAFLVAWALVVVAVQVLDYYVPIWGTKKMGGGKKGAWGSAIGIVVGMFLLPPWGIIIFPFVGALVGELIDDKEPKVAAKAALGALLGFLAGTVAKLVVSIVLTYYFVKEVVIIIYNGVI